MITETTAISCAAFGALSTGLGIGAGIGWIRCARMLAAANKLAAERAGTIVALNADAAMAKRNLEMMFTVRDKWMGWHADQTAVSAKYMALASDLQERLDTEAAKRSSITSRGNLTKAAKRKAAISATTNQLQREVAERAEPARIAA